MKHREDLGLDVESGRGKFDGGGGDVVRGGMERFSDPHWVVNVHALDLLADYLQCVALTAQVLGLLVALAQPRGPDPRSAPAGQSRLHGMLDSVLRTALARSPKLMHNVVGFRAVM